MAAYFQGVNGEVTDRTIACYKERAKGQVGLIICGGADITPTPYCVSPLISLGEDRFVQEHYYLTEAVHAYGTKIAAQLAHMGSQISAKVVRGGQSISPSGVQQFFVDGTAFEPGRTMSRGEIYEIIGYFAEAAGRAKKAGYDMVEIHGCHGHLIGAFMSPATNKRTDEFGGSLENRMRLAIEIVKQIRRVVGGDYPISFRLSADEFIEGGITLAESPTMAKMLEAAGANVINVSCGTYATLHKSNDIMRTEEGWKSPIWSTIKKAVRVPTIAGGGLRTPEFCEKVLADGTADFIGLGRQLLADPEWPKKASEGRIEDIRKCYSCFTKCLYELSPIGATRPAARHCAVNAAWGREIDFAEIKPATVKKKVIIVGGGVAGMEAARIASLRGHDVTLYEKKPELGGQLLLAAIPPGKQKMLWLRDYLATQIKKQNVAVRLETEVTPELVKKSKADAVIVATGAEPFVPPIPGIKSERVVTAWDVLGGKVKVKSKNVVIIGGGMVGCETAEFLAERGNKVTVVEMLPQVASDLEPLNRRGLLEQLKEYQVALLTNLEVTEVTAKGVIALDRKNGEQQAIEAQLVVLALGAWPVQALAETLEGKVSELYIIGDCQEPRRVIDAVYEGSLVGRQL
jgi:2,4-dienoyl-CoA reductase-like NADH-dependent reductase (Old Yellow Enzyme family)/thioredoxin reductase